MPGGITLGGGGGGGYSPMGGDHVIGAPPPPWPTLSGASSGTNSEIAATVPSTSNGFGSKSDKAAALDGLLDGGARVLGPVWRRRDVDVAAVLPALVLLAPLLRARRVGRRESGSRKRNAGENLGERVDVDAVDAERPEEALARLPLALDVVRAHRNGLRAPVPGIFVVPLRERGRRVRAAPVRPRDPRLRSTL